MSDSKVEIKLDNAGIKEILKSQFMMDALMTEAERVGEVQTSFVGFDRCQVIVKETSNAD